MKGGEVTKGTGQGQIKEFQVTDHQRDNIEISAFLMSDDTYHVTFEKKGVKTGSKVQLDKDLKIVATTTIEHS